MSQEDTIFLCCLVLVPISAFLLRHWYKRQSATALFALAFCARGCAGLFLEREKSAELAPAKPAKLANRSRWEVLALANIDAGAVAIIKNEKTGKVAAVQFADEKPPEHFQVWQRGWWKWQTTRLIPIHQGEN